jgi:acyl carrier protein
MGKTTTQRVIDVTASRLNIESSKVKTSSRFVQDLRADHMDCVEIIMALEEEFDIEIPDDQAETMETVGKAVKVIDKLVADKKAGKSLPPRKEIPSPSLRDSIRSTGKYYAQKLGLSESDNLCDITCLSCGENDSAPYRDGLATCGWCGNEQPVPVVATDLLHSPSMGNGRLATKGDGFVSESDVLAARSRSKANDAEAIFKTGIIQSRGFVTEADAWEVSNIVSRAVALSCEVSPKRISMGALLRENIGADALNISSAVNMVESTLRISINEPHDNIRTVGDLCAATVAARDGKDSGLNESVDAATESIWVLLFHQGLIGSNIIKWWTKDAYSHSVLSMDPDFNVLYSFGIKGKQVGFMKEKLEDYGKNSTYSIYEAKLTPDELARLKELLERFENAGKTSYNILGIIYLGLTGKDLNISDASFYCSQFVRYILTQVGAGRLFGRKYSLRDDSPSIAMKPYDFAKSPGFKFVKRGILAGLIK